MSSEIEDRIHQALAKHALERTADGYRLVHPGGVGVGTLRFVPVAVIGSSTGAYGAVWAQAELRKVLGSCGARVVEGEVALGHTKQAFESDDPLSPELRAQLRELLADLVTHARERAQAA